MMGEIPKTMRQKCRRDEPGAYAQSEERRDGEEEGNIELDLLLKVVAAGNGEAEIDACDNTKQDRSKGERHIGREEKMRDQRDDANRKASCYRPAGEDRVI